MMNRNLRILPFLAAGILVLMSGWARAQQARVSVELEPDRVRLGNAAKLIVRVENGRDNRVFLPKMQNLVIQFRGQEASSQNLTIVNGQVSFRSTQHMVYAVIPYEDGEFTIPPIEIQVDGQTFKTKPLKLTVLPGQAPKQVSQTPNPTRRAQAVQPKSASPFAMSTPSPSRQPSTPSPGRSSSPGRSPASVPRQPARSEPTFMEMEVPKKEVFVGEMIPVKIKWYVRRGIRYVSNFPVVPSEAFVTNLPETQGTRHQEYVGNEVYDVNTWEFTLTAVKEGKFEVDGKIETMLTVPVQPTSRDPFSGFSSRFNNRIRRYEKTVTSGPHELQVKPLPTEGRPANFDGAVGEFNLAATASPEQVDLGEPITLTTTVTGIGDLNRVNTPTLAEDTGWRVYPPNSEVELEPGAGNRGKKVFEQAIIPRQPGIKKIPKIEFSYFNPNTEKYVTRSIEGPPVRIIGSPDAIKNLPAAKASESDADDGASPGEGEDSILVANKRNVGNFTTDFTRVALQPWFLAMQGVPLLALLVGFFIVRRKRRLENDPEFARQVRLTSELQEAQSRMGAAVSANDEVAFFAATRDAIRHRLALHTEVDPVDVTPEVIAEYAPESTPAVREIFSQADAMTYGSGESTRPLSQWQDLAKSTMTQMEQECRTHEEKT